MTDDGPDAPRLFGVLVTYRRPDDLEHHLTCLRKQTRTLDQLTVVDNAPTPVNERLVATYRDTAPAVYLPSKDNSGAAGGIAQGLRATLPIATERDWVVLLDDDNPPRRDDLLERLFDFARRQQGDVRVGAVGLTGSRFDWRRARLVRPSDRELDGDLDVDFIGGNQFPMLRVGAVREVGVFRGELFWGLDDLDFGLRLRRLGYRVMVSGELVQWARAFHGHLGLGQGKANLSMGRSMWRHYYTLRNLIDILRRSGHPWLATRVAISRGLAKGGVQALRSPRRGAAVLRLTARAIADGWSGNLGRTVEPVTSTNGDSARQE
jgi:GT2 family glycosyltransferase